MSIHSKNEEVILQFGLKKPAFRICGEHADDARFDRADDGLDPAMTLGCGGWGGNITSDNISPKHLLNVKRLAYEVRPAATNRPGASVARPAATAPASGAVVWTGSCRKRQRPPRFRLRALQLRPSRRGSTSFWRRAVTRHLVRAPRRPNPRRRRPHPNATPLRFVCEDDVRGAAQGGEEAPHR
jgi:hypothetical protein